MSEHKHWRHRWAPQHVTTVDMTGTINAPQWEPVHVLNDAELAALVTPTREHIAETLKTSSVERDGPSLKEFENDLPTREHYAQADALLALLGAVN